MKKLYVWFLSALASLFALPAFAQTTGGNIDLSAITGAFTAQSIITGIMAIAAILAAIYAAVKAAKMALAWIRGG